MSNETDKFPLEGYKARIRDEMLSWLSGIQWTHFVTFNFNTHTSLVSGRTTIKRFHAILDRKLYGRHFNEMPSSERTLFIAFPEHVESNLHYHALLTTKNDKFSSVAIKTWESLIPSGSVHIVDLKAQATSVTDYWNISRYSTKELHHKGRYNDFIISSQFSSV